METVKVNFYKVNKCGFYRHGGHEPEFGSFDDLISQLSKWSKGKKLGDTKIVQPDGGNDLPVYFFGIEHQGGCSMITMWNEVPANSENKVASVPANDVVGKVSTYLNDIKQGTIPGFPTFFFAMPAKDVFATVRVDGTVTAQSAFQNYCEQFLAMRSSYVVLAEIDPKKPTELEIVGYSDGDEEPEFRVYPRFRTSVFTKKALVDHIIANFGNIKKVHRKSNVDMATKPALSLFQEGLNLFGLKKVSAKPKSVGFRSSMNVSLTEAETKGLIKKWEKVSMESEWDDFGFEISSDKNVNWLSGSVARGELNVDDIRGADGQVDAKKLLAQFMQSQKILDKMLQ